MNKFEYLKQLLTEYNNIFKNYRTNIIEDSVYKIIYLYSDMINEILEKDDIDDYLKFEYKDITEILILIDKSVENILNYPSLRKSAMINKNNFIKSLLIS